MSQLQSCEINPTCGIAFRNLSQFLSINIDNPTLDLSSEISNYKPSDADGLLLYNNVTSCYSVDLRCMPSSGSGSGSGSTSSGSGSGSGSTTTSTTASTTSTEVTGLN